MAFLQSRGIYAAASGKPRVAFLGPLGSFSHEAAYKSFGDNAILLPEASFPDALSTVQANKSDFAAIPLENSSNGAVVQTFDLLADRNGSYSDITVCGEYYLPVQHCLLVKKGDKPSEPLPPGTDISNDPRYKAIKKLYTHPQAWGQCEKFLSKYFKNTERQDVSSTSKGAEIISKETTGEGAAIASKFAGQQHDVDCMVRNIEDDSENTTRFLVFRNVRNETTEGDCGAGVHAQHKGKRKTLISFMVDHNSPGALADALVIFKRYGMNLTSINSRPGGQRPWQYVFFVECQSSRDRHDDKLVERIMGELEKVTESARHLGSWQDMLAAKGK